MCQIRIQPAKMRNYLKKLKNVGTCLQLHIKVYLVLYLSTTASGLTLPSMCFRVCITLCYIGNLATTVPSRNENI